MMATLIKELWSGRSKPHRYNVVRIFQVGELTNAKVVRQENI